MVTLIGGSGFVGKYIIKELLENDYEVVNLDLVHANITDPNYRPIIGDAKNLNHVERAIDGADFVINLAAILGGIAYFHKYPASLLVENERILATVFETLTQNRPTNFKKILQFSSSMVFESTFKYPSTEEDVREIPPPLSVYGFQKLSSEYFCQAFQEQYNLPYVIVRPFNIIGVGEDPLADSHVVPQLVMKALAKQTPFQILGNGEQVRVFTHGRDLAKAVLLMLEKDVYNTDFNISNEANRFNMFELAKLIWRKINPRAPFIHQFLPGYKYDVRKRVGSSERARKVLSWKPSISLEEALDEIIEDVKKCLKK